MRNFTSYDVQNHSCVPGAGLIMTQDYKNDLLYSPLGWQKRGLQETVSGYGNKLNSGYFISYEGKKYRIYVSCYGNSGSSWFKVKGRKIFVH